jgi:hypothetical protein
MCGMQDGNVVTWRLACGSTTAPNSARNSPSPSGAPNGSNQHTSVIHPGLSSTRGAGAASALIRSSATFERFVASSRGLENLVKAPSPPNQQEVSNGQLSRQHTRDCAPQFHSMQLPQRSHESALIPGQSHANQKHGDNLHAALVRPSLRLSLVVELRVITARQFRLLRLYVLHDLQQTILPTGALHHTTLGGPFTSPAAWKCWYNCYCTCRLVGAACKQPSSCYSCK